MGKSITPKYAVEFTDVRANGGGTFWTPMGWRTKQAGRPTAANLAKFIAGYEASTLPGGCNSHLGETKIGAAVIRENCIGGAIIASYARS